MKLNTGNLFELAEKILKEELNGGKIMDYGMLDIIDRAVYIRKKLDKLSLTDLYTKKELRHMKYLKTGR
jgi:hypothetical protein